MQPLECLLDISEYILDKENLSLSPGDGGRWMWFCCSLWNGHEQPSFFKVIQGGLSDRASDAAAPGPRLGEDILGTPMTLQPAAPAPALKLPVPSHH